MKRLYLASSIDRTAGAITKDIGKNPKDLKLVFISTAAEPEKGNKQWLEEDRNGWLKAGFEVFDYTLTGKNSKDIRQDLASCDIVHVNGGNSLYLLLQARKSGFDRWVGEFILSGQKIYTGSSAGSMAAAPDIGVLKELETQGFERKLRSFECFGLVDFIIFPHWGSDYFKSKYLGHRMEFAYKPENKIILLNDWQFVKV